VSIDEGDRAVGYIKDLAKPTFTKGVMTAIGSFGPDFACRDGRVRYW